jgi:hypothetical protein
MAWTEQLRAGRENHTVPEHPWRPILETIKGDIGRDGVERIATDRVFDLLDVLLAEGMPRYKRTPEAQKQLKAQMVLLGWCPVHARLVTRVLPLGCEPTLVCRAKRRRENRRPACRSHHQTITQAR